MAYKIDLLAAARRHREAADHLDRSPPHGRPDVAAYLYGICAECALKYLMMRSGMRPTAPRAKDDPFYLHFPELKTVLRDTASGRNQGKLMKYASDASLMNGWNVAMRYSNAQGVVDQPVSTWRSQATRLLQEAEDEQ